MSDDDDIDNNNKSLINIKVSNLLGLNDPGRELIKQICGGAEGLYKPVQTILNAKANAKANEIKAESDGKIAQKNHENQLQIERAKERIGREIIEDQENIERIAIKAAEKVKEDANIDNMSPDFKRSFTENARLIYDEDMQKIWADILAGEANSPGSFSKKTLSILQILEKSDAELFEKLCRFNCQIDHIELLPIIYEGNDSIYRLHDINYNAIIHLSNIGLINYRSNSVHRVLRGDVNNFLFIYHDNLILFEKSKKSDFVIFGHCSYTSTGLELAKIRSPQKVEGFLEYTLENIEKQGHKIEKKYTKDNIPPEIKQELKKTEVYFF